MNSWKVILATLVIYAAGIFTGAVVMKAPRPTQSPTSTPMPVFPGGDIFHKKFLDRMKSELNLSAEQIQKLDVVFRESRERMKTWWDIIGPEFRAEVQDVRDRIRAELTADQREKFEVLMKDRRRSGGAGGPGGPGENRPREHSQPGQRGGPRRSEGSPPGGGQPPSKLSPTTAPIGPPAQ